MPKDDAAACRKALPIRILSCFLPDAKAKYVPVLPGALAAPRARIAAGKARSRQVMRTLAHLREKAQI